MDEEQYSEELTALLLKLTKGHRVDMGQVVHGLSDVERDIFMVALDIKGKTQQKEFTDLIEGKD